MHPAFLFLSITAMLAVGCQCSLPPLHTDNEINIVSYNVHNLFDAEESGKEYPEFRPSKGKWTKELYAKRLENVVEAVRSLSSTEANESNRCSDPDILCFQELENEKVLFDLAERLGHGKLRHWAMSGPEESIIHTGILSRFPIVAVHSHSVTDAWELGILRDVLEVELECGAVGRMVIFACHWKSKLEGEAETEPARRAAAALIANRIRKLQVERPSIPMIVCGDFNESPDEYIRVDRCYPTAIMCSGVGVPAMAIEGEPLWAYGSLDSVQGSDSAQGSDSVQGTDSVQGSDSAQGTGLYEKIELYTPWAEHPDKFSLAYREKREQYDGFLLSRTLKDGVGLEYQGFYIADSPMLFTAEGVPREWRGTDGYSDHLPVELVLSVVEGAR
ncbi:MAG: endonuclease/exonuclease/phosphatase family protein [Rectinema sp.]